MKSSNSKSEYSNTKFLQSSSFKQIIRGVESLIDDDDELEISTFQSYPSKPSNNNKSSLTNGEKLQALMKNHQLRDKLNIYLKNEGLMDLFPILKIDIKASSGGQTQFPIHEQDLYQVFKRFDNLQKVMILGNYNYAFYNDHVSAYFAMKTLNDLVLRSVDVKLHISWCQSHQYYNISGFLNFDRMCPLPELSRSNSGPASKFTCRFKIQIQNQKQFQVARKIIGPKGTNMKKIIDNCLFDNGLDPNLDSDVIKLRLRGQGSGYKEGPSKIQSDDPLHLCISCREEKVYLKACQSVQSLLYKIYEEYKNFCIRTGRKIQELKCMRMDTNTQAVKQYFYNFQQYGGQCADLSENQIRMYIEARNKARREMNFTEADRIRSFLKSKGIVLIDQKGGRGRGVEVTTWKVTRI